MGEPHLVIAPVRELGVMIRLGKGHTAGEYDGEKCFHTCLGRTSSGSVTNLAHRQLRIGLRLRYADN